MGACALGVHESDGLRGTFIVVGFCCLSMSDRTEGEGGYWVRRLFWIGRRAGKDELTTHPNDLNSPRC